MGMNKPYGGYYEWGKYPITQNENIRQIFFPGFFYFSFRLPKARVKEGKEALPIFP